MRCKRRGMSGKDVLITSVHTMVINARHSFVAILDASTGAQHGLHAMTAKDHNTHIIDQE